MRLFAACHLDPSVQSVLRRYESDGDTPLGKYNAGLLYLENQCFSEARQALDEAEKELVSRPTLNEGNRELLGLVRAARSLTAAEEIARTDPQKSIPLFVDLLKTNGPSVVTLKARLKLASLLDPKALAWSDLERELGILADLGYFEAELRLADHFMGTGRHAEAVSRIESHLKKTEGLQASFAFRVLLADLYRRTGRLLEARLMATAVEKEGAEEMLDPYLRIEFLRVQTEIARARVQAGEAGAAQDLAIYEAALQEIRTR